MCGVDVPGGRATLPATREFEVNDFFINHEVAFSQETDLLRCIIAILAGHEHCHINEAEQLVLRAHPLHRIGVDTEGGQRKDI